MLLPIAQELPPPRTIPLAAPLAQMRPPERRLAEEAIGTRPVFFLVKTRTRVDVGHWLRDGRLWAAALIDGLELFAPGRRPYRESVPFAQLRGSVYNPVTGELALVPAHGVRVRGLKMPPLDGYQMLAQIYSAPAPP